jgi:hypothetical protein
MLKRPAVLLSLVALMTWPATATAQDVPLSELVIRVLVPDITLASPTHAAHFRGFEPEQIIVPLSINSTIVSQLGNVPLASSSSGFTWTLDPTLGTFSRKTSSFGPAFAERAFTSGAKRWSAGFNYQRSTYDSFEGQDLDGEIKVYLLHADSSEPFATAPPDPFFEGDVIENTMNLKLTSDIFTFFANYGVTDRLDLGLALPIVSTDMDVTVTSRIVRQATSTLPFIHSFDANQSDTRTISESGSATGLGDIILRGKYALYQTDRLGLAAGLDLRVPTGDEENLLGTGGTQTKLYFVASGGAQRIAPHVNLGYTFAGGGYGAGDLRSDQPNEFNYTFGVDTAVTPRVTFAADFLGRSLIDAGRLELGTRQVPFMDVNGNPGVGSFEEFVLRDGNLNLAVGAAGVKWNPRGTLLISAHGLFPLTKAGLRDNFTAVIGIDYSF